jgi:anti-anti-sigma factor
MTMATSESPAVRRRDGVAVIDLVGDVDRGAEEALEAAWQQATAEPADAVVLNFEGAGYINSTGIALIVGLLARARAAGIEVRAYGLTPHYREIFEITRLADFLAINPDEDSAVRGAEGSRDA